MGKISNLTSIFFRWVGEKPPTRKCFCGGHMDQMYLVDFHLQWQPWSTRDSHWWQGISARKTPSIGWYIGLLHPLRWWFWADSMEIHGGGTWTLWFYCIFTQLIIRNHQKMIGFRIGVWFVNPYWAFILVSNLHNLSISPRHFRDMSCWNEFHLSYKSTILMWSECLELPWLDGNQEIWGCPKYTHIYIER